jgi:hypothetical protein
MVMIALLSRCFLSSLSIDREEMNRMLVLRQKDRVSSLQAAGGHGLERAKPFRMKTPTSTQRRCSAR